MHNPGKRLHPPKTRNCPFGHRKKCPQPSRQPPPAPYGNNKFQKGASLPASAVQSLVGVPKQITIQPRGQKAWLRDLGCEHLQNTWSRWNCIAWSKSALLLELSWLLYFLLYFAPLAKSLGDKKVPSNEKNIAKVFGKDTTNQGHECLKTYVQTSLSPSHNMANM